MPYFLSLGILSTANSAAIIVAYADSVVVVVFEVVDVDLFDGRLDGRTVDAIVSGWGVSDRSASLFGVASVMVKSKFTDAEILSVLTDTDNFLGETGFDHAKTTSRKRAAEWVYSYTIAKIKARLSADTMFAEEAVELKPLTDAGAEAQVMELLRPGDWRIDIERNIQDGRPKPSFANIKLILTKTMKDEPFLSHNEFSIEDVWQKSFKPWRVKRGACVRDADSVAIKAWLSATFRMEPAKERIDEVLIDIAQMNSFHPVREYLESLEWDGTPRLETWLADYLGASGPASYLRDAGVKTLVAMVARIYRPGLKFDTVLILEGPQGIGKSSAARILAEPWFSDSVINVNDKDAVMNMQGVWVYELGELSAMSRADVNSLKEFITRSTDRIRPPYGRRAVPYPRQSVFIGTTNSDEYLKDKTGNRRFWPVKIKRLLRKKLERDRDQLLAEAAVMFDLGEELWIESAEGEAAAMVEQAKRVETDAIDEVVGDFLRSPPTDFDVNCFRISDLISALGGGVSGLKNDRTNQMRLAHACRNLGWDKCEKRVGGVKSRFWSKVNKSE